MVNFRQLNTTLAYARLGLVSLTAAVAPITGTAQELCGTDLFEGEPDAASLMSQTIEFLDVLESNGVVAFEGSEGRLTIDGARRALVDGVGSVKLLSCVVNSDAIEFSVGAENRVIACDNAGGPSVVQTGGAVAGFATGQLFCTAEVATVAQYIGSEA